MRVLIAARGEVAVRIARTVKSLGWEPITIHTRRDRLSPHTRAGLLSLEVPSYTDADAIVEAAARSGVDILHPGYGFLSESPEFAEKVLDAGISWAGPSPKAMRLLGDKWEAKRLAEKLGVPTVPWCEARSPRDAERCAEKLGTPVVLKASRAGGGRGMRVAGSPEEAARFYGLVAEEARRGFGDSGVVFVERLVERPRHVEVQVLGESGGRVIHLYERECSVQRRRQKIIEEAPSPLAERERWLRERLLDYALRLAEAVEYESAGTIEFIVDEYGGVYFIEANTRLQVEHGVTELVTGVDIVEQQLLVAAERGLSVRQEEVALHGWAVEARVYAENPWDGFRASRGRVTVWRPPSGVWLRVDHAVEPGVEVDPSYDTLLAKIIAYGRDRGEAVWRLSAALREAAVGGVETNIELLRVVVDSEWFRRGAYTTTTLEERLEELLGEMGERRRLAAEIARHLRGSSVDAAAAAVAAMQPQGMVSWHGWPWPPSRW